jgi:hypothetical protein
MRIRAWASVLVILMVAGQAAIGSSTDAAAADGFGGPCASIAPGAMLPPPVYFTTATAAPYVPRGVEFTDTETLPLSNFSATAHWGDETTTAATVGKKSSGCFEATAPSHTYASPGAYSFSYTVHDAHTGLDHTIGAEQFYVWSLPQPLNSQSPRAINATVGVPWSGVLGEFSYLSTPLPTLGYTAEIEWGVGQPWSPGTITMQPNGTFAVSGSHTYTQPSSDTVSVLVGAGDLMGKWATSSVSMDVATPAPDTSPGERPQFKFVGQPIAAAIPSVKGKTSYEIIFRLNRQLPRIKSGRIQAQLIPYGGGNSIASFGPHETHMCYAAGSDGLAKQHPKGGHRYPFTLAIQRPTATEAKGHAILHRYFNFVSMLSGASKRLGC